MEETRDGYVRVRGLSCVGGMGGCGYLLILLIGAVVLAGGMCVCSCRHCLWMEVGGCGG